VERIDIVESCNVKSKKTKGQNLRGEVPPWRLLYLRGNSEQERNSEGRTVKKRPPKDKKTSNRACTAMNSQPPKETLKKQNQKRCGGHSRGRGVLRKRDDPA